MQDKVLLRSVEFIEKNIKKHWHWVNLDYQITNSHQNWKKKNKAARVVQIKFLDWFYKPVCKDGTFGLNCLLAQRLCKN
jgi:hypothetical protein